MRNILYIMTPLLLTLASCDKIYEEKWDSLYYTDEYGDRVCRMHTSYDLTNDSTSDEQDIPFSQPIAIYYSGHWTVEIVGGCDWGYIDRTSGDGVHYIHFTYLQNRSGATRNATLRITCDNAETCDITLTQKSL